MAEDLALKRCRGRGRAVEPCKPCGGAAGTVGPNPPSVGVSHALGVLGRGHRRRNAAVQGAGCSSANPAAWGS